MAPTDFFNRIRSYYHKDPGMSEDDPLRSDLDLGFDQALRTENYVANVGLSEQGASNI